MSNNVVSITPAGLDPEKADMWFANTPPTYSAKDEVPCAAHWMWDQVRRKRTGSERARQCISALKSFFKALAPDDPKTIEWLLANMDKAVMMWANSGKGTLESAKTYRKKASWVLEEYAERCKAGSNYDENRLLKYLPVTGDKVTKKKAPEPKAAEIPIEVAASASGVQIPLLLAPGQGAYLTLPSSITELSADNLCNLICQLALHTKDFSLNHAAKICARLASQSSDFDVMKPFMQQMFPTTS